MTPEGRVKEYVKRRMQERWPTSYRFMPVQNGMGAPGLDFFYCVNGYFLTIETKAPGKKPTPRQLVTAGDITKAGGVVWVVDSVETLEEYIIMFGADFDAANL